MEGKGFAPSRVVDQVVSQLEVVREVSAHGVKSDLHIVQGYVPVANDLHPDFHVLVREAAVQGRRPPAAAAAAPWSR